MTFLTKDQYIVSDHGTKVQVFGPVSEDHIALRGGGFPRFHYSFFINASLTSPVQSVQFKVPPFKFQVFGEQWGGLGKPACLQVAPHLCAQRPDVFPNQRAISIDEP